MSAISNYAMAHETFKTGDMAAEEKVTDDKAKKTEVTETKEDGKGRSDAVPVSSNEGSMMKENMATDNLLFKASVSYANDSVITPDEISKEQFYDAAVRANGSSPVQSEKAANKPHENVSPAVTLTAEPNNEHLPQQTLSCPGAPPYFPPTTGGYAQSFYPYPYPHAYLDPSYYQNSQAFPVPTSEGLDTSVGPYSAITGGTKSTKKSSKASQKTPRSSQTISSASPPLQPQYPTCPYPPYAYYPYHYPHPLPQQSNPVPKTLTTLCMNARHGGFVTASRPNTLLSNERANRKKLGEISKKVTPDDDDAAASRPKRSSSRNRKDKSLTLLCKHLVERYENRDSASPDAIEEATISKTSGDSVVPKGGFLFDAESRLRNDDIIKKRENDGIVCRDVTETSFAQNNMNVLCIDTAASALAVERRRIYDIINILEALCIVERKCKNMYYWRGLEGLKERFAALQWEAIIIRGGGKDETRLAHGNDDDSDSDDGFGSGRWRKDAIRNGILPNILSGHEEILKMSEGDPVGEAYVSRVFFPTHIAGRRKDGKEKWGSLGMMCKKFLQLYLVGYDGMSLPDAAEKILGKRFLPAKRPTISKEEDEHESKKERKLLVKGMLPPARKGPVGPEMKTKIRRLYDIANVMVSLGMVKKIDAKVFKLSRNQRFAWAGIVAPKNIQLALKDDVMMMCLGRSETFRKTVENLDNVDQYDQCCETDKMVSNEGEECDANGDQEEVDEASVRDS